MNGELRYRVVKARLLYIPYNNVAFYLYASLKGPLYRSGTRQDRMTVFALIYGCALLSVAFSFPTTSKSSESAAKPCAAALRGAVDSAQEAADAFNGAAKTSRSSVPSCKENQENQKGSPHSPKAVGEAKPLDDVSLTPRETQASGDLTAGPEFTASVGSTKKQSPNDVPAVHLKKSVKLVDVPEAPQPSETLPEKVPDTVLTETAESKLNKPELSKHSVGAATTSVPSSLVQELPKPLKGIVEDVHDFSVASDNTEFTKDVTTLLEEEAKKKKKPPVLDTVSVKESSPKDLTKPNPQGEGNVEGAVGKVPTIVPAGEKRNVLSGSEVSTAPERGVPVVPETVFETDKEKQTHKINKREDKGDVQQSDAKTPGVAEAGVPEAGVPEAEVPKPEATKPDGVLSPTETSKPEAKPEVTKPGIAKPVVVKEDLVETTHVKPEVTKAEVSKPDGTLSTATKAETPKMDSSKLESPKTDSHNSEVPKAEVPSQKVATTDVLNGEVQKLDDDKSEVPNSKVTMPGSASQLVVEPENDKPKTSPSNVAEPEVTAKVVPVVSQDMKPETALPGVFKAEAGQQEMGSSPQVPNSEPEAPASAVAGSVAPAANASTPQNLAAPDVTGTVKNETSSGGGGGGFDPFSPIRAVARPIINAVASVRDRIVPAIGAAFAPIVGSPSKGDEAAAQNASTEAAVTPVKLDKDLQSFNGTNSTFAVNLDQGASQKSGETLNMPEGTMDMSPFVNKSLPVDHVVAEPKVSEAENNSDAKTVDLPTVGATSNQSQVGFGGLPLDPTAFDPTTAIKRITQPAIDAATAVRDRVRPVIDAALAPVAGVGTPGKQSENPNATVSYKPQQQPEPPKVEEGSNPANTTNRPVKRLYSK